MLLYFIVQVQAVYPGHSASEPSPGQIRGSARDQEPCEGLPQDPAHSTHLGPAAGGRHCGRHACLGTRLLLPEVWRPGGCLEHRHRSRVSETGWALIRDLLLKKKKLGVLKLLFAGKKNELKCVCLSMRFKKIKKFYRQLEAYSLAAMSSVLISNLVIPVKFIILYSSCS